MSDKYKIVGPLYDIMSSIYSLGAISDCKKTIIDQITPGQTVLFAGAGHGEDAIEACLKGADVTVVELSLTMADQLATQFRNKLANSKVITDAYTVGKMEIIVNDIFDHKVTQYDFVVANFFLNVFDKHMMEKMLAHLTDMVKEDTGTMVVGDFKYPTGNIITRTLQNIYWFLADLFFVIFSGNSCHKLYDYRAYLSDHGFVEQKEYLYSFMGIGYEAIVANRVGPRLNDKE